MPREIERETRGETVHEFTFSIPRKSFLRTLRIAEHFGGNDESAYGFEHYTPRRQPSSRVHGYTRPPFDWKNRFALLSLDNGSLSIQAGDNTTSVEIELQQGIQGGGNFGFEVGLMRRTVSSLSSSILVGDVVSCSGAKSLLIREGPVAAKFSLPEVTGSLFPSPEKVIPVATIASAADLLSACQQSAFAASNEDGLLNDISFAFQEKVLVVQTIGRSRAVAIRREVRLKELRENKAAKSMRVLLPKASVEKIAWLLQKGLSRTTRGQEVEIRVEPQRNEVQFSLPGVRVACLSQKGDLGDLRTIIPKAQDLITKVLVRERELLEALKVVQAMARRMPKDQILPIELTVSKSELTLTFRSLSLGDVVVRLPAEVEGSDIQVALNYFNVLGFLRRLEGIQKIEIGFVAADKPVLFSPEADTGYQYLVMPLVRNS